MAQRVSAFAGRMGGGPFRALALAMATANKSVLRQASLDMSWLQQHQPHQKRLCHVWHATFICGRGCSTWSDRAPETFGPWVWTGRGQDASITRAAAARQPGTGTVAAGGGSIAT
eukprot:11523301-Karenia_brevis.AAC.1